MFSARDDFASVQFHVVSNSNSVTRVTQNVFLPLAQWYDRYNFHVPLLH